MDDLIRVYISGPISQGDKAANLKQFCDAHRDLLRAGMSPFNPGLSMLLEGVDDITHDQWVEADLSWVKMADVVLRLPGASKGADREVEFAGQHGIEVIYNIHTLIDLEGYAHLDVQTGAQQRADIPVAVPARFSQEAEDEQAQASGLPTPELLQSIRDQRSDVYGDPKENHKGIAMMWAPMLEPYAQSIADMEPLPEHTIAHMMALLKIDRMRLVYHRDNYDDLANYIGFAQEWQGGAS